MLTLITQSSFYSSWTFLSSASRTQFKTSHLERFLRLHPARTNLFSSRELPSIQVCRFKKESDFEQGKKRGADWPVLRRWDVPWEWKTVSLTLLACGLSFVVTALVVTAAVTYSGLTIEELSPEQKTEVVMVYQTITTPTVLGVLYCLLKFQPVSDDMFVYDLREPFNLQKGWLLWAGVGLLGAVIAAKATEAALSLLRGDTPDRETDALLQLLPLIGSSSLRTACLVGTIGVLGSLLEEAVFRGFFMVALTKWVPTPVAVLISAAIFSLVHLTPGEFPQLFVFGCVLGFSYAQTRNLLTPIAIHALWNSGIILFLTFLQVQGYDIREFVQAP